MHLEKGDKMTAMTWRSVGKKEKRNMHQTCNVQYNICIFTYIITVHYIITSCPRGWKEHTRLSEKKIPPIYRILTIDFWFCPAIGLRYWKCLSKCDRFQRGGPPEQWTNGEGCNEKQLDQQPHKSQDSLRWHEKGTKKTAHLMPLKSCLNLCQHVYMYMYIYIYLFIYLFVMLC